MIFQVAPAIEALAKDAPKGAVMLLPESTLGRLDAGKYEFLLGLEDKLKASKQVMLIGAEVTDADRPQGYKNGLVVLGEDSHRFIEQRVPVPVSMWRPWSSTGAKMDLAASGVTSVAGLRAAVLVCYEQLLTFPAIVSTASHPQTLLAASSAWWAKNTSIPKIQRSSVLAWARLSQATPVLAVNF